MMRDLYMQQLSSLNDQMLQMGALCEQSIVAAIAPLQEDASADGRSAMSYEEEIDRCEREIESLCLKLFLKQQPVAHDLRRVSAALKMITDLERIGDQAADISEIVVYLDECAMAERDNICQMAHTAVQMIHDAVDSYAREDLELASYVISCDDVIDDLFVRTKTDLSQAIARGEAEAESALDLLMIAKYLERVGDHATNVAEWAEFCRTGSHEQVDA